MSVMMAGKGCVAFGDCNTEGFRTLEGPVWAQHVASALKLELENCGHTMSTTRELLEYAREFPPSAYPFVFIQYGLVDSWHTFRGAPYVLYYPDSPRRKLARKLVKKLKKWARHLKLQKRLGAVEVVPLDEYIENIRVVLRSAPESQFVLVATAPNLDISRNPGIQQYNEALSTLASEEHNATCVDAWDDLWGQAEACLMEDGTHLTSRGHRLIADRVLDALRSETSR
ncbi:SGNH/GDSL hydrolase family protein [Marinobacter sp. F3R11]|uniref:SGNH/GDSL hydrolase family protein n=1 Tax=Marinobacter sp. F3R11 TaxID=2267231 RepID=UPI000DEB41ED|nr:GDSL-type esterase/lipase family protein [Marinobacter sp. F3R11]RBW48136.1 SGNH/GDSL hydrolase family protein [Marinobacter sp. F3R11]